MPATAEMFAAEAAPTIKGNQSIAGLDFSTQADIISCSTYLLYYHLFPPRIYVTLSKNHGDIVTGRLWWRLLQFLRSRRPYEEVCSIYSPIYYPGRCCPRNSDVFWALMA